MEVNEDLKKVCFLSLVQLNWSNTWNFSNTIILIKLGSNTINTPT